MNILFLSTHLNAGGITSYLFTLTKGLLKKGHKVFVVTSGGDKEGEFRALGAQVINLSVRTKSELSPKIYFALKPVGDIIRNQSIDIIHAHTRITQVMGQLLKNSTKKPYVATCHGYFRTRWFRRLFPCWGDAVIAISPAVRKHLVEDFKVPESKVVLIESGVDIEQFPLVNENLKRECRQKLNLNDDFVIGNIARLSDVKGPDILIAAMKKVVARFPQAKLLFFGEGKMEEALRKQVSALNLNNNVVFYPIVNKTAEYLPVMDIFVMPSRQEGLGLSIMEAQACGLPVVASNVGGIPSLIQDGETGLLVRPENSEHLAFAIIKLLENKDAARKMGLKAREFIREKFSADFMIDKTISFYLKMKK